MKTPKKKTPSNKKNRETWSGRFEEPVSKLVQRYTASVEFDQRLAEYDIKGSSAHAQMLADSGIITAKDLAKIEKGLRQIQKEIHNGTFDWRLELEDVHLNIEKRLTTLIGDAGKRLHTARSRNDQIATDVRLYMRASIDDIIKLITAMQLSILDLAEANVNTVMPGLTHLQIAQPISFGHHLMAYFEMLKRDKERLSDCRKRVNILPLGAAALAGTSYPINRKMVAKKLGFDDICKNSLDAVSDRDFTIEFCACSTLIMTHLSRLSEELILWMSPLFGFIQLDDRFCTGSSIMPQKKNPDVPELVRGKTGRVNGNLIALLTLMKGQPLAYNKDNQEDKEPLFDTVDTLSETLRIYADMLKGVHVDVNAMRSAAMRGYSTATDLADYLTKKGVPFRDSHETVAKAVRTAEKKGCDLSEFTLSELQKFSQLIEEDIFSILSLDGSMKSRNHTGGTAPSQVRKAIKSARKNLS
ncbi:MAG: argininosuccinate lyase [Nitrosomonadaceae bacterium]|nr:argininosuccinate lyase [Nitrosomonadaceae bacterium]